MHLANYCITARILHGDDTLSTSSPVNACNTLSQTVLSVNMVYYYVCILYKKHHSECHGYRPLHDYAAIPLLSADSLKFQPTNNYRKNFFVQRVDPVCNSLPPSIVDLSSFTRFKLSLNNVNLRIFTRF